MNKKLNIIICAATLTTLPSFHSLYAMHSGAVMEQRQDAQQAAFAAGAGGSVGRAPVGPSVAQAKEAQAKAASRVIKAQKSFSSAGGADTAGTEALQLLEKLPAYGLGILKGVRNQTKYSITIRASGAKNLHDQLPEGTIVRLKSLDPQFGEQGKYFTVRKDSKGAISFKADTDDTKDKSTYFVVTHRVSQNLKDWVGFTHPLTADKTMQVTPGSLDVNFLNKSFKEEKDTQSHWEIVGKTLSNCALRNRKTRGGLTFFSGEREQKKITTSQLTDTYGIEQAPCEILEATFGEGKGPARFNVTDQIRVMAYKDGKIEIPAEPYEFFGKPKNPGSDARITLDITYRNGNTVQTLSSELITEQMPTDSGDDVVSAAAIVTSRRDQKPSLSIDMPGGAIMHFGSVVKLDGSTWQRIEQTPLEYNKLITIVTAGASIPDHVLWAHYAAWGATSFLGTHADAGCSDVQVTRPSDPRTTKGAQLLLIRAAGNRNKTGPISYGDRIEIWSSYYGPEDLVDSHPLEWKVGPERWFHNDGGFRDDYQEILTDRAGDDQDRNKRSTFTLRSPTGAKGTVNSGDLINIITFDNSSVWVNNDTRYTQETNLHDRCELLVGKAKNPANQLFKIYTAGIPTSLTDIAQQIYSKNGIAKPAESPKRPGKIINLSVRDNEEIWAIDATLQPWKWDGKQWVQYSTSESFKQISVGNTGDVWAVSMENKVWQKQKEGWAPLGGEDMRQISLITTSNVWGINAEDDFAYQFTGKTWEKNSPDEGGITLISASSQGNVWAIDKKKRTWKLTKDRGWLVVNSPPDGATLITLAVRSDDDVWATGWSSSTIGTYHWDGKVWTKQAGILTSVAVASGVKKTVTKLGKKAVQICTTTDENDKPLDIKNTPLKIEVVQLGIGGNLPPRKTVEVNIPLLKNPSVAGFAETRIESFLPGAKLILSPLFGKGGAWPENSLTVPGRTTVSFLASPETAGDIYVLLGSEISDNYTWKIVIGGWNNTKSAIIKRTMVSGEPKETIMYEITKKQNPLAFAPPGNFTPYWVSYDKGFIIVGMGTPGQNPFMAQRVKEPATAEITQVAFSSNKTNVEITDIQFLPPIIMNKPERVYAHSTESIALGANQSSFTWTKYPFRSDDNGTVAFDIQGTDNVVLALGQDTSMTSPHYAIVFSADKAGIMIKKWDPDKKQYIDRAILPKATYPAIGLDPAKTISVWVSYHDGLFSIGQGAIGQNPLLVYKDLNNYENIDTVGFGTFGQSPATITNLTIAPPVIIDIEKKEQAYQTATAWYKFKGAMNIIMPFHYQFSQREASVMATDMQSNEVFYSGATPQQGADYSFILSLGADGYPKLDWATEPDNPAEQKVKKAIVSTAAAAELARAKAELETQTGARLRATSAAAAKVVKTKGDSIQGVANTMTSAAGAIGMGGGMNIGTNMAALGMDATLAVGGVMTSGIAAQYLVDAAKIDNEGAKVEAMYKQNAEEQEAAANKLQWQSNMLTGNAQFAFKDPKAYVFVDDPFRAALGSAGLPADVIENAQKADDIITQAGLIKPTTTKNFEMLLSFLQDVVFLITHSYVANPLLKQKFLLYTSGLYTAYQELYASKPDIRVTNDFINLLLTAMNNGYLLSSSADAEQKEAIYTWMNKLSHNLLMKMPSISLKACYGEYIWLPIALPQADQAQLTLTVEGRHDVLVCFAKEPAKVRNTPTDLYEIVLAGWDNTKHAVRIQSLGQSVKEFTKDDYPDTMMNPYQAQTYQIQFDNGKITVQTQGKEFGWTDPYPIKGIKWVGISTWDTEINFKKISLKPLNAAATAPTAEPKAAATQPSTAADAPKMVLRKKLVPKPAAGLPAAPSADTAAGEKPKMVLRKKLVPKPGAQPAANSATSAN